MTAKKGKGPREKIGSGDSARFIRRGPKGQFTKDQVDVGKSLAADRRQKAKKTVKPGYGDQGDQPKRRKGK